MNDVITRNLLGPAIILLWLTFALGLAASLTQHPTAIQLATIAALITTVPVAAVAAAQVYRLLTETAPGPNPALWVLAAPALVALPLANLYGDGPASFQSISLILLILLCTGIITYQTLPLLTQRSSPAEPPPDQPQPADLPPGPDDPHNPDEQPPNSP